MHNTLRRAFAAAALFVLVLSANAVVVRGRLTDALGRPIPNGHVDLQQDHLSLAQAFADEHGNFELRASTAGRFIMVSNAPGFLPAISDEFYGRELDVVQIDIIASAVTLKQDVSVTATGLPTPLPQLTAPVSLIPDNAFAPRVGIIDELRLTPGAFFVQSGQAGTATSLFMRGGDSTANLVLIDGVPAGDVGGSFDFGTVSSTAVSHVEIYRGPNSALFGTDAGASVITINTPRGSLTPTINYSGDAGTLHSWRNEVTFGGAWRRLDFFAAFSRFDTSNALALDRYHSATSAANIGYDFNGNTSVRFTIRRGVSASGVPGPYDFQGLSSSGKQGDQDLYSAGTLEDRRKNGWHNLIRFGIARKREQDAEYQPVGTPDGFGDFLGKPVTIQGANGYKATGQIYLYSDSTYDQDSNRDQLYYQSDKGFSPHFNALFGFRYDNERGSFNDYIPAYLYTEHEIVSRRNYEYTLQFQGQFFGRLFYSASGALEKNHLYGIAGTPKLGLGYAAVRPGNGWFHGTKLRVNYATGVQEPKLSVEYESLYDELLAANDTADIAKYRVGKQSPERSRTYDYGLDQNIHSQSLILKLGYFHNMFDRQLEGVTGPALAQYFGLNPNPTPGSPNAGYTTFLESQTAYVNSLAFRAQGAEAELQWQPAQHFFFRGGYTYLAATVIQSFSGDALAANSGTANVNPNIPNVPLGVYSPLVGARPFRRAPNTGFFDATYSRSKFSIMLKGAMSSRSDDSTFLDQYSGPTFDNSLLLPNRNLDYGYVKLDLGGTYQVKRSIAVFAQLDNLLNNQHIGPIGYPGLPLTFRAGLKIRLAASN